MPSPSRFRPPTTSPIARSRSTSGCSSVRPHDAESYYKLGDAYIEKGRETGDIAYFELASQALRKALQIDPELGPAHRHLALVLYTLHDFGGAIDQSQAALKLDPRDAYAYGVIGDARLETGDYRARRAPTPR